MRNNLLVSFFFFFSVAATHVQAKVENEPIVVRLPTEVQLMPLELKKFNNEGSSLSFDYLTKLESVLQFDLNHNGMTYTVASPSGLKEKSKSQKPLYSILGTINSNKQLSIKMESVDEDSAQGIEGISLTGNLAEDRCKIHQAADAIYKALFNQEGIASTHILYSVKKKAGNKLVSEIWEADYDGENARPIVQDGTYNITPVYIPAASGHRPGGFLYVSYKAAQPKLYVGSFKDGSSKRLISMRGNQLMPSIAYSKDMVLFTCDITGNPDLFLQPFNFQVGALGKPRQVFTSPKSTQGSSVFSPDGSKMAFVSNKDGSPRIYVMEIPQAGTSINHLKPQLISKSCRESSAPSWSPDGTKLAYCAQSNGVRQIWIYDFSTREERQLTEGPGNKENPSWGSNSVSLIFNSSGLESSELYLVNLYQPHATKITSGPGEKRFPNWEVKK